MYICFLLFVLCLPLLVMPPIPAQTRYVSYMDMPHAGPPVTEWLHSLTAMIYRLIYLISAVYVVLAIIHRGEYSVSHHLAPAAACFAAATLMRYLCSSES